MALTKGLVMKNLILIFGLLFVSASFATENPLNEESDGVDYWILEIKK